MKAFTKSAAQGDVLFIKIDTLPDGLTEETPEGGKHIVAHSETGHHHFILANKATMFRPDDNAFVGYLSVKEETPLVHDRSFDTHEPLTFAPGNYEIRRQREYTPEGYRRAAD